MATYVKHDQGLDDDATARREALNVDAAGTESATETREILSADLVEVEHGSESFPYGYLPEPTGRLLREAFACFSADLHLAFAILCRHALGSAPGGATEASALPFERLFDEAATLGDIDAKMHTSLRAALFGPSGSPEIDADEAAVLIEIVKDMFHQRFVRTAKLRRAIKVRRFFAHESRAKRGHSNT